MFIFGEAYPEVLKLAGEMKKIGNDYYFYGKENTGFIIFPDSMADEKAYAYYAKLLHEKGYTVVIAKAPYYLRKEKDRVVMIMEAKPEIENWYFIGHAQGGWTASKIAVKKPGKLCGIAFLASYIYEDLSEQDVSIIRILGSRDEAMNPIKKNEHLDYLPENSTTMLLRGGNHRGFAACDFWGRDGESTITWKEQQERVIEMMLQFFKR